MQEQEQEQVQKQEQGQEQVQGHPTQPRHEVQGPRAALTSKVSW